jgi:4-alpha-glucanotransferase
LLISLDVLAEQGLLDRNELRGAGDFDDGPIDYPALIAHRQQLWPRVLDRFAHASPGVRARFDQFCRDHAGWLDDYALFMSVKADHRHRAWTLWETDIAQREPSAVARWSAHCAREIQLHKLTQFLFFEQWHAVRAACRARSIEIVGDLPIFVAHDSADVWVHRDLFKLDANGQPTVVAGVPPDYFSATGQLWGNPHYRWDTLARSGYAWWIDRFRATLDLVDRVRIDHFRGFVASWEVPFGADTAAQGRWLAGPGAALFEAVEAALGLAHLPFIAENLGVITPEVEALRERFGFPGMAILQFAFGSDPQAPDFKPHNYPRNRVVYTGTHDNDTTMGWWTGEAEHSTRSAEEIAAEREHARRYLGVAGPDVHWAFIRGALASVAATAVIPAQDLLGLGSEARMNQPGTVRGNWRWRLRPGQLTPELARELALFGRTFDRT